jgi:hypothetical protein
LRASHRASCAGSAPAADPEARLTGPCITLAARWLDPGETEAAITRSGALCAARRAREAHAGGRHDVEPRRVVDSLAGRPHVRLSPAPELRFTTATRSPPDDVKFSFERYKGGARLLKERVREVQVVDPRRVRFVLKEPWPTS